MATTIDAETADSELEELGVSVAWAEAIVHSLRLLADLAHSKELSLTGRIGPAVWQATIAETATAGIWTANLTFSRPDTPDAPEVN